MNALEKATQLLSSLTLWPNAWAGLLPVNKWFVIILQKWLK